MHRQTWYSDDTLNVRKFLSTLMRHRIKWTGDKAPSILNLGITSVHIGPESLESWPIAPKSEVPLNSQMSETSILIRLLWIIFHGIGNSAQLCQNFGISGGLNPSNPPRYATGWQPTLLRRSATLPRELRYTYPYLLPK
jgi:hypothetical protein